MTLGDRIAARLAAVEQEGKDLLARHEMERQSVKAKYDALKQAEAIVTRELEAAYAGLVTLGLISEV